MVTLKDSRMSLVPLMFSDWWEVLDRPHRLWDQHFGLPLSSDDVLSDLEPMGSELLLYRPNRRHRRRLHPFLTAAARKGRGASTVQADKDKFQVTLDVSQFSPDEVTVKVVDKNVVVEAKHEEKEDEHGWVSRQFKRKYIVPSQCDIEQVESHMSSDGILSITAPRKEPLPSEGSERPIKICLTGKPALNDDAEPANGPAEGQAQQNQQTQQVQPQAPQQQQQRVQQSSQQQQSQRGRKSGRG